MKTCGVCSRILDDQATVCNSCGAPVVSASGGPAPPIAWQPLKTSASATASPAAGAGTAGAAGNPAPPPATAPGAGWSSTGYQAPGPQAAPPQPPPPQFNVPPFTPPLGSMPSRTPPFQANPRADLKPLIPRTDTGNIHKAEQARDRIHSWMEAYCKRKGIEPSILKSTPYSPSIWVECRAWTPEDPAKTCTDRCLLNVAIKAAPFHRYEILYEVTTSVGAFSKKHTSVCELGQNDVEEVMNLLLTGDLKKIGEASLVRLRDHFWEFWRPKNKLVALDNSLDIVAVLNLAAFLCLFLGAMTAGVTVLIAVALWIAVAVITSGRNKARWRFQNEGKPMQEPRYLRRLDSWQTLVFEFGKEVGPVRQEILAELRKGISSGFIVESETIWYWGLDGKEEREQLVARFRRGIAFIQIYAYGQDLFVGWDGHINEGTWVEKEVARGFKNGRFTSLRTVEAGRQGYTEYDLFDTNCLVEWVHGAVVKVVKRKMTHHQIDQEIDFKIIRGDRNIQQSPPATQQPATRKLFKRVE